MNKQTLCYLACVYILFFGIECYSQDKIEKIECGDKIESSFTKNHEWQGFQIDMEGGDNLKVVVNSKYGDFLKFNVDIYSPADNVIIPSKDSYKSYHQIETGPLPGTGTYGIVPYNYQVYQGGGFKGELGDFVIEVTCEKANGEIISAKNTSSSQPSELNINNTQFLSIPLGTPMDGEIRAGSNQLFGFKTTIERNKKATLNFSLTEGNIPLEVQIIEPNTKEIIFFSSFGNATSQQTTLNFPRTSEYIITIKESSSYDGNGTAKFKITLQ